MGMLVSTLAHTHGLVAWLLSCTNLRHDQQLEQCSENQASHPRFVQHLQVPATAHWPDISGFLECARVTAADSDVDIMTETVV